MYFSSNESPNYFVALNGLYTLCIMCCQIHLKKNLMFLCFHNRNNLHIIDKLAFLRWNWFKSLNSNDPWIMSQLSAMCTPHLLQSYSNPYSTISFHSKLISIAMSNILEAEEFLFKKEKNKEKINVIEWTFFFFFDNGHRVNIRMLQLATNNLIGPDLGHTTRLPGKQMGSAQSFTFFFLIHAQSFT